MNFFIILTNIYIYIYLNFIHYSPYNIKVFENGAIKISGQSVYNYII